MLSHVISRCKDKWRADGVTLAPPLDALEVRRVWNRLEKNLSSDVLELYSSVGGFQEYTFDNEFCWCLWPWDWLQNRNAESPSQGVMFCDHSIEVVTWELRYEDAQNSSVWTTHGEQIAATLDAFLDRYLKDPWSLLELRA